MARPAESCAECRALVAADQMALHIAWHAGLTTILARINTNHPHGPVAGERGSAK
jgi:hypothetical protein